MCCLLLHMDCGYKCVLIMMENISNFSDSCGPCSKSLGFVPTSDLSPASSHCNIMLRKYTRPAYWHSHFCKETLKAPPTMSKPVMHDSGHILIPIPIPAFYKSLIPIQIPNPGKFP